DGTVHYVPNADYNGLDSFTYTISDGHGGTATGTVSITVTVVNDAPTVPNYTVTTNEDTPANGIVTGVDANGDSLTYAQGSGPSHGTVTVNSATGAWTYTPTTNYNGPDSFTVTVSDGHDGTATATVSITVNQAENVNPGDNSSNDNSSNDNSSNDNSSKDNSSKDNSSKDNSSTHSSVGAETVPMQQTGIPIGMILTALLMVLTGFAIPKRK
ncbi:MAG: cadherin-like domain-containing protein, partial [Methanobacterium paludis]|nr:cadherin-like domain-containing protein [Methanobacterium paludis]